MMKNFDALASKIIFESTTQLNESKILSNFKSTGEFKRLEEKAKDKEKFSKAVEDEINKMTSKISEMATKYNEKKLEFIQFSNPDKKGGLDGGWQIPLGVERADTIKVVNLMTKKEDRNKENKQHQLILGIYLTKDAYSKIKDAC